MTGDDGEARTHIDLQGYKAALAAQEAAAAVRSRAGPARAYNAARRADS